MEPDLKGMEPILALCRVAGEAIMTIYAGDSKVRLKDDRSPLTEADLASHRVLIEGLQRLTPRIPVISEEGDGIPWEMRTEMSEMWIVDPLDGTKEFLKRTGEFTVNVALIRNGVPIGGIVHAPALRRSWIGGTDGAMLESDDGVREPLHTRPLDRNRLVVAASRDHAGPAVEALLERLPKADTLSMGSSLKFCLVAEGKADLYYRDGPTMEWDTAAAQCVLERAGGGVFTTAGHPLGYNKSDLRNPHFVAVGDPMSNWQELIHEIE